jgi:hypothetical protein
MNTHSLYSSSSSPSKKSSLLDNYNNINIKLINTANSPSEHNNTSNPTAKTNNTLLPLHQHQHPQHNKHINNDDNYNNNNINNNNNNKYLKKKTLTKDTTSFHSTPTTFKPSLHLHELPSSYTISTPEDLHFLYVHLIHTVHSLETTF